MLYPSFSDKLDLLDLQNKEDTLLSHHESSRSPWLSDSPGRVLDSLSTETEDNLPDWTTGENRGSKMIKMWHNVAMARGRIFLTDSVQSSFCSRSTLAWESNSR